MDFHSSLLLNLSPLLFELLLSLSPNIERLVVFFFYFCLRASHKLIQSELSLNKGCIRHQEFKLLVIVIFAIHPPSLLDHYHCVFHSFRPAEHSLRKSNLVLQLVLIQQTVEQLLLGGFLNFFLSQFCHLFTIYVGELHIVGAQHFFELMEHETDAPPLGYVSSLERHELRCRINYLKFPDDNVMRSIFVHQLFIGSRFRLFNTRLSWYHCPTCTSSHLARA